MKAAVHILLSEDTPAVPSEEYWRQLCEKHLPAFKSDAVLPNVSQASSFTVNEDDVRKAVLSFPAGSAGGPDSLRSQHLRDMVLRKEAGPQLIMALTGFINLVLAGRCPTGVAPVFFGSRLLALSKKSSGVRPIAIGFSLRRFASKCANQFGSNRLKS